MGDWILVIKGMGPHDNNQPYDIEAIVPEVVARIKKEHQVYDVKLVVGGEKLVKCMKE